MKYLVASPIKFGNKHFGVDATVDIPEEDAQPHLESGVLLPAKLSKKEEADAKAKAEADARAAEEAKKK